MRGAQARLLVLVVGVACLAALAACPPSKPPPVRPDADAAPAIIDAVAIIDAAPPIHHVACGPAAKAYAKVCATSDPKTTALLCSSIIPNKPDYADCLMKAGSCDDGTRCDNMANVKRPPHHGPVVNGH